MAKERLPKGVHPHDVHDYALAVVNGEVLACEKVVLACWRHLKWLKRKDLIFSTEKVDRFLLFASQMKHPKGVWESPFIQLQPWQIFIVGCLFGWLDKKTKGRVFKTAYIQIPRKNGKSTLASMIAIYMLLFDGEMGADVYSAATTRDQARIVYNDALAMIKQNGTLSKMLKIGTLQVFHSKSNSTFKPLSADSNTLDGLNIHCALVDELHAHKTPNVWNVLDTGTGSRRQPLLIAITTAGFFRGVAYEQYQFSEKLLKGIFEQDTHFCFISEIDEGDNWQDPTVWAKANPNLNVSLYEDQLQRTCEVAIATPSQQNNFLCKHLNVWTNQATAWLSMDKWEKNGKVTYTEKSLLGRACFGGLDLATSEDLAGFVLLFPPESPDEGFKFIYRVYVPAVKVKNRSMGDKVAKVPYDAWVRDGHLRQTEGELIEFAEIREEILRLSQLYNIKQIAYDPFRAVESALILEDEGLDMLGFRQGSASMHAPMKRLEELITLGKLHHGNNPAMNWMSSNMVVRLDANGNMAPDKKSATDKIDGIVAMIMALGISLHHHEGDDSEFLEFLRKQ